MPGLSHLGLSREGLAFNPATGDAFLVNESGAAILRALADPQAGAPDLVPPFG
jgi:hypothetical protein